MRNAHWEKWKAMALFPSCQQADEWKVLDSSKYLLIMFCALFGFIPCSIIASETSDLTGLFSFLWEMMSGIEPSNKNMKTFCTI
jgi:hypothetical protein